VLGGELEPALVMGSLLGPFSVGEQYEQPMPTQ
jgi:hypothetical protein